MKLVGCVYCFGDMVNYLAECLTQQLTPPPPLAHPVLLKLNLPLPLPPTIPADSPINDLPWEPLAP